MMTCLMADDPLPFACSTMTLHMATLKRWRHCRKQRDPDPNCVLKSGEKLRYHSQLAADPLLPGTTKRNALKLRDASSTVTRLEAAPAYPQLPDLPVRAPGPLETPETNSY